MASVRIFHNTKCLKCGKCHAQMVMVGPMVFCNKCFKKIFAKWLLSHPSQIAMDPKIPEYHKWIEKYKNMPF
jgi:DNA-directed RNA polymerase subunit RPC12/RpoP